MSLRLSWRPPPTFIRIDMKVRAPGNSVIYQVQLALWFSRSPVHSCGGPPSVASLPLLVTFLNFLFTNVTPLAWNSPPLPRCHPAIMPRERGKPKRGPLYYSSIARRSRPDPSLPLPRLAPLEEARIGLRLPLPPLMPRTCLHPLLKFCMTWEVSRWKKKFLLLSNNPWKPSSSPSIITRPQARPMEHGSCLVEEEIPPSWLAEWIAKNSSPGLDEEETPLVDFDMDTAPPTEADGKIEHTMPNPHRFSDDHLQLIFDMRRSLEDQTQNQRTLNDAWTSCLMPCQMFWRKLVV
jgi:hypothetical protein